MELVRISRALSGAVDALHFEAPVSFVYNPLSYARLPHEAYLRRYGVGRREVLLVGMNPGPFGMAQTGVPFGDVPSVRDFLGVAGRVEAPAAQHEKRPILGFDCPRREVSGRRLWGWVQERFRSPEAFFGQFFVVNYCPLAFLEEGGRNRTPDKLPAEERRALLECCDRALASTFRYFSPRWVVGIGAYAAQQAQRVASQLGAGAPSVGSILHPSPASPLANRGWAGRAEEQLRQLGVTLPA